MPPFSALPRTSSLRFGATLVLTHQGKGKNAPKLTHADVKLAKQLILDHKIPGFPQTQGSTVTDAWISRSDKAFDLVRGLMPHKSGRYKILCTDGDSPLSAPPTQVLVLRQARSTSKTPAIRKDVDTPNRLYLFA